MKIDVSFFNSKINLNIMKNIQIFVYNVFIEKLHSFGKMINYKIDISYIGVKYSNFQMVKLFEN